jgi:hypothetical protein
VDAVLEAFALHAAEVDQTILSVIETLGSKKG